MFINKLFILGLLVSGFLTPQTVKGQTASTSSGNSSVAVSNVSRRYTEAVGNNSRLYSGPEYVFYDKQYRNNEGHQFFETSVEQSGDVVYDGQRYTDVPLLYDIHLDQVVIKTPTSPLKLRLVNEKVQSFSVHGHTFVRIVADPAAKLPISTGFYDLLVDNTFQLLIRRNKTMLKKPREGGVYLIFSEHNDYFIMKDNIYYPVSGTSSFSKIFPEIKSSIQKYSRSNNLKFNSANKEISIIQLALYTDLFLKNK